MPFKRLQQSPRVIRSLLASLALVVASTPTLTSASIDSTPATPSIQRVEELFGAAGLTSMTLAWPVAGPYRISSTFGTRHHPVKHKRSFHYGIDIAARAGTPIVSVAPGRVVYAGWRRGYGRVVEIEHGQGWVSRYAHAKSISVEKGQLVLAGQMLGKVGRSGTATGAHLHLELELAGKRLDPMAFWANVSLTSAQ